MMGDNWNAGVDRPGGNPASLHSQIQQPALEDLKNALTIADMGTHASYVAIANAIRRGLEGLSEPNLASVQAAATMLREKQGDPYDALDAREVRDIVAVILKAAVTGEIPQTWSEP